MTRSDEPLHQNLQRLFETGAIDDPPSAQFEGELSLALRRRVARRLPERVIRRRRAWTVGLAAAALIVITVTVALLRDSGRPRWRTAPDQLWIEIAGGQVEIERGFVETRQSALTVLLADDIEARLKQESELAVGSDRDLLQLELTRGDLTLQLGESGRAVEVFAASLRVASPKDLEAARLAIRWSGGADEIRVSSESGLWTVHYGDRVLDLEAGRSMTFGTDPVPPESALAVQSDNPETASNGRGANPDDAATPCFGRCIDDSGRGLPGVALRARRPTKASELTAVEARTADDGTFEIALPPGSWWLEAGGVEWGRVRQAVAVEPGVPVRPLVFSMAPARMITGWAQNTLGQRLDAVTIQAEGLGEDAERLSRVTASVESGGSFRIAGLAPGSYRLVARRAGHAEAEALGVEAGESDVELTLPALLELTIEVRQPGSDRPVPAFEVTLEELVTSYDRPEPQSRSYEGESGRLTWPDVAPGSYRVWVQAPGQPTWRSDPLELTPGTSETVTATLGGGGWLTGVVVGIDGEPVAGARVFSLSDSPPSWGELLQTTGGPWSTIADESGHFRLGPLSSGVHKLRAHRSGAGSVVTTDVSIRREGSTEIELRLEPTGTLQAEVKDEDGEPVQGRDYSMVVADGTWYGLEAIATTDASGRFELDDLLPGEYFVIEHDEENETPTQSEVRIHRLSIRPGRVSELLVGGPSDLGTLSGRVLDAKGRPQPRTTIIVIENDFFRTGTSDEQGRYSISHIPAGRFQVLVQRGFSLSMSSYTTIALEAGESRELEVRLPEGRIRGRVLTAETEAPIGSASLLLYRPGDSMDAYGGRVVTNLDGSFELGDLQAGTYLIVAIGGSHGTYVVPGIVLSEETPTELTIRIPRGADFEVRLQDARTGEPIRNAFSLLFLQDGPPACDPSVVHMSDSTGRIRYPGCRLGAARLLVAHPDYGEHWVEVDVRTDATGPREISLERKR